MSEPQDQPAQSVHRSRWRRFSPSMGWRAFWSEIVIVVLGVVIALAANEAVQDWTWRNKVKDAEVRLQGDITWVFLWAAEKYVSQSCVDSQLAVLSRRVLASGDTLQPVPVLASSGLEYVVRMPNRPYRFPAWDALVADGTANHFPPQRQAFIGRISDSVSAARTYEMETRRLQGALLVMRDPIPLDPVVKADLLSRISDLRSVNAFQALYAEQRMRMIADVGSAPPDHVVESFLNGSGEHQSGEEFSGTTRYCKAQGQPVADWRDYRKVIVAPGLYPGVKVTQ